MPSIQGIQVSLPIQRAHLDGLVVFVAVAELRGFRAAARGYAMKAVRISGTENYAEEAPELLKRYENISFADYHRLVMHLIPTVPGRVLDIGAGTGRDAAGFVSLGHSVVAVEPTEEFRRGAMLLHPSPMIEWVDDSLPDLAAVRARGEESGRHGETGFGVFFTGLMGLAILTGLDKPLEAWSPPRQLG
jgi:SAM-dependent methyltransferase